MRCSPEGRGPAGSKVFGDRCLNENMRSKMEKHAAATYWSGAVSLRLSKRQPDCFFTQQERANHLIACSFVQFHCAARTFAYGQIQAWGGGRE